MSYDCIIIGAGHNGLTTATRLATSGRSVLVLERRDLIGGLAAGEEFHPGYRSVGALHDTTNLRPEVVKALNLEAHGLVFEDQPPSYFIPSSRGNGLLLDANLDRAVAEIGAFSAIDAQSYKGYRTFMERIRSFTNEMLLGLPAQVDRIGLSEMVGLARKGMSLRRLGKKDMMEMMRIPLLCAADWVREWFETDLLQAALVAPAVSGTFTGPWSPGNNLNLLLWECGAGKAVKGGAPALVSAMEKAARSAGVEIRTGSAVKRIRLETGKVTGVLLENGEQLNARSVAASCDPRHTFLDLIDPWLLDQKLEQAFTHWRCRGTTAKVNLALKKPLTFACRPDFQPEWVRTGEDLDELERAFDAVKYGQFSQAPVLDIHVPTVANPELAPKGHAIASILVHFAPYQLRGGWNDQARAELGRVVMQVLEKYAPGIQNNLVGQEVLSPVDLEERYGISGGHIHHGEHALDQLAIRPDVSCANHRTPIEGLFLCGSGSSPGGGLTGMPGLLAARAMGR